MIFFQISPVVCALQFVLVFLLM